jgi:lysyl endopeptidase
MKFIPLMLAMGLTQLFLTADTSAATNFTYLSTLDIHAIHAEELVAERKGEAPRYAVPHAVALNPSMTPHWEKTTQGIRWTHRVHGPQAVSLNFGFTQFYLPKGVQLNIYSTDRTRFMRPFTYRDNNINKQLWTPVIMSDDVTIELLMPEHLVSKVRLELGHIGQGFRTFGQGTKKAGACNVDVACGESQGWEKEVNSVGVISTGGSRFCTGFMVNNTAQDRTPYFMTANHCRVTPEKAPSLVVYWNYQRSSCKGPKDGKLTDFQTGSVHLSSNPKSDATLVRLNTMPLPQWNVTYAGWDATDSHGSPVVAIHHPNVDEKSISFEYDPTAISSYLGNSSPGEGTHIWVKDWDVGTTEPGSSGSPLFDLNHRVIGQLHGGYAACGNNSADYYGRFHLSYRDGKFAQWLDPVNSGVLTTDTL